MYWECARCGAIHTQNPSECRSCGHSVFSTLSGTAVRDRSEGVEPPSAMNLDDARLPGTTPDEEATSGPDVAPDGSVVREEEPVASDDEANSVWRRLRSWLPF